MLIGVGRWGSADPWLGIPVAWDEINGARVIVESELKDIVVEPSQGSHFFQNLTSFGVGYFSVLPAPGDGFVDWEWLRAQPARSEGEFVRHLRFEEPVIVKMDGHLRRGVIFKPGMGVASGSRPAAAGPHESHDSEGRAVHSLAFVLIALGFIAYGAVSAVLERSIVSAPMVFLGFGLLLSPQVLGLADFSEMGVAGETLVEATLALVLFSDAVRIDLRSLRQESAVPVRLLAIGLPLTLVLGFGAGFLPGLGLGWEEAGLLAAMLAATDAALGRAVVTDRRLPQRIAQGLNVESGLNDGVAVPFVLVFLSLAAATPAEQQAGLAHVMAQQIGLGALGGVAAGMVGGTLLAYADRRGWVDGAWRQIITLATALLAFSLAAELGGSGFIGAYAGGIVFALAHGAAGARVTHLADQGAEVLSAAVFVLFGIVAPTVLRGQASAAVVLYALLSLTVVRMLPVAVSMTGMKMRRPTLLFLGWFGPRGLASIAFAFLVLAEDVPHGETIVGVVFWTVLLSVLLHGVSAVPLTGRYAAWYAGHDRRRDLSEAVPAAEQRHRRPARSAS